MSDILTALTMLKARGGVLDLKVAEIIEDLAAQLVGNKVGTKLEAKDRACLEERIAILEQEHRGALFELDEIWQKLSGPLGWRAATIISATVAADAAAEEIKRLRAELAEAAFHAAMRPTHNKRSRNSMKPASSLISSRRRRGLAISSN